MKLKVNRYLKLLFLVSIVFILAGCGNLNEPINSQSTGIWDKFILYPLSQFIIWLSQILANNYALGIISFTILIRLLLMPLTIMQMKSQNKMMELQPEIEAIKEKYPGRDKYSVEQVQKEQQALFEEKGVNQFAGCLPTLVQFPIMMALYQVISRTEVLKEGHFLWTSLGKPDPFFILPILAAIFTFLTTYLNFKANPQKNPTSKIMMISMPIMIFFISFGLPSAISLYWTLSHLITVVTILIFNNPYKRLAQREAEIAEEKAKQKRLRKALKKIKKS